ncbi:MAG TPA: hypothetical protein VK211_05010 [Kamptonema sp.]|nr:hypothetical protein [Kamptonema sp.]
MTLSNIRFPEENPFCLIKFRHLVGWWLLVGIGISFQIAIPTSLRGIKFSGQDPFYQEIIVIYLAIFSFAWLLRQFKLVGINVKQLVGKVAINYQWLPIVGLVIARVLFSIGSFRVSYYYLSFLNPSLVENLLIDNINNGLLVVASKTFSPPLYCLLSAINLLVVSPIFYAVIFQCFLLHRWATKWGNRGAIIALCLLFSLGGYRHIFGIISLILVYTLLYLKTRTLIVPLIAIILDSAIFLMWSLLLTFLGYYKTVGVLEQFRSQFPFGVFCLVLSAPWVMRFIYKNWYRIKEPLPYFTNSSE